MMKWRMLGIWSWEFRLKPPKGSTIPPLDIRKIPHLSQEPKPSNQQIPHRKRKEKEETINQSTNSESLVLADIVVVNVFLGTNVHNTRH